MKGHQLHPGNNYEWTSAETGNYGMKEHQLQPGNYERTSVAIR